MTDTENNEAVAKKTPSLIAYHVEERNGKKFWTEIGAAWPHGDGKGHTVEFGRIVFRVPSERKK